MEVIYQGAESIIYIDLWDNQKVVVKERIKKRYRIEQIDIDLRKLRTRKEAKLLTQARKCGVTTPKIFDVDEKNYRIIMEFVEGQRLKEFFQRASKNDIKKVCFEVGKSIGRLHSNGIVHGDLTTSNIILKDSEIFFIDFGLGEFSDKVEDKGIDLNLLYEALNSTHFKILKIAWESIIKGYKEEYRNFDEVLNRIVEIERRARYMERN